MTISWYCRIFILIPFLLLVETAPGSPFWMPPPDTLNGTTGYGSYSIIRTDTSFSGTVCDSQAFVEGTFDADSVYLTRALLDSSDFRMRTAYLPGDADWSNAMLLISSFCKNLIDINVVLVQKGTRFPSGEIALLLSTLEEQDPECEMPTPPAVYRLEFFSGSLTGDFLVRPLCMAIVNPGTTTNLTSTSVAELGILLSISPVTPTFTSSDFAVAGTARLSGAVSADSVFIDGSTGRAAFDALSLTTRTLDADAGDLNFAGTLSANKTVIGKTTGHIKLSGLTIIQAGPIQSPLIAATGGSKIIANGLVSANDLRLTSAELSAVDLDAPLVTMNGSTASMSNISLVDSLTMSSAEFHGGLSMSAKKISGINATLGASLLQVTQGPALIDLSSSQINAGTLDAYFMDLDACTVNFGTIVTRQSIAHNSSFEGGLLNARTGRSLFSLDTGSVTASHINAGTYDARDVTTTAPFMEGDTLLTLRGSIHDPGEDSLRIQFLHRSDIDNTLVYSGMIYASLAQAEVTQGSRFESDRRGEGARLELIAFPGDVALKATGASYGGYGGTNGDMNVTKFIPADDPVGVPDFSADEIRKGLGGFGGGNPKEQGGTGGGRIRIDASSLLWNGYASVNGGDADQPLPLGNNGGGGGGGGTGGTVHIDVSGMFSGNGRIESNGGNGTYGFGGDLSFLTGSGGSGGRIRINYGTLGVWNGTVKALGGLGGTFDTASVPYYGSFISPWIDSLNHGGPGTIYWKLQGGNGRILIDGDGGPGGVGRVDGDHATDTVEVRGALVVTNGLNAGGVKLVNRGILRADNPRVRLRWPSPPVYGISGLFSDPGGSTSGGALYPTWVWQDSLRERLTIGVAHDIIVDATSRLDLTGQGGYSQTNDAFSSGAYGNRAGGSHGGYGGWGRWVNEHHMGRPNEVYGDPVKPEDVGEGGFGVFGYVSASHRVNVLGGAGGGALRLTVGGSVLVDGMIVSDGARGIEDTPTSDGQGTGGGAGGSIWITAFSLAGTGIVSASGGDGSFDDYYQHWGGGGGGGRIRIDYGTRSSWSGEVKTFGGRGGQLDSSHLGVIPWTNPRMHGGAGTVFWNTPSSPALEIRNFTSDSGASALSGTFPGIGLTVRNALVGTSRLAVASVTLQDHAVLTGNDNRTTLYAFPGFFSVPNTFPFWTPKVENFLAIDAAGNLSIDATSRIDGSGLGGFSRLDYDALRGAAPNPAGGSYGGVGGTGRVDASPGIASPTFGDSTKPVWAGLGGFGDESLPPASFFYEQCGAAGSGGAALRISVGGILSVLGSIRSIGLSGIPLSVCAPENNTAPSGGAGGSIYLAAGQLTGSGLIDASGGQGVFNPSPSPRWGGGGGGGRIAVYGGMTGFTGTMRVNGGLGGAGNGVDSLLYKGQLGTIYLGYSAPDSATPFAVVGASVASGDTGVSRTDPFRLLVNKPARLSSFVFTLSPDPGGWNVRGNFAGDSVWLDHASLAQQTTYTLRIAQLRSMFGDTLGAGSPRQWVFSTGGTITGATEGELLPREFALDQNYPNPFNPTTTIRYALPQPARVTLTVYNILGQHVATLVNSEILAGYHEVRFDASRLASGVYLYRLQAGGSVMTRKLLLLK